MINAVETQYWQNCYEVVSEETKYEMKTTRKELSRRAYFYLDRGKSYWVWVYEKSKWKQMEWSSVWRRKTGRSRQSWHDDTVYIGRYLFPPWSLQKWHIRTTRHIVLHEAKGLEQGVWTNKQGRESSWKKENSTTPKIQIVLLVLNKNKIKNMKHTPINEPLWDSVEFATTK